MTDAKTNDEWPGMPPSDVEAFILEAVQMIRNLDDTGLHEMTPHFYQHGYEQVKMTLEELLKILGYDPNPPQHG